MARRNPRRDRKGRFIKKGSSNPRKRRKTTRKRRAAPRRRARRNSTRAGQRRVTARRAYRRSAPNRRRRRSRKNPTQKQVISVLGWATGWAWASAYLRRYLTGFLGSPVAGNYGTAAVGLGIGLYMSNKARRAPAGYAILGVSLSVLAEAMGKNLGIMPPESGAGFVSRRAIYRPPPRSMNIARKNPIANIVVP